jgi:predicted acylesterase/phospholipase RssA
VVERQPDNIYLRRIRNIQAKLGREIPKNKKEDIGIFSLSNRSISIMLKQITALTLENHQIDIMVQISRDAYGAIDFYKAGEIIKGGEAATLKALNTIRQQIK